MNAAPALPVEAAYVDAATDRRRRDPELEDQLRAFHRAVAAICAERCGPVAPPLSFDLRYGSWQDLEPSGPGTWLEPREGDRAAYLHLSDAAAEALLTGILRADPDDPPPDLQSAVARRILKRLSDALGDALGDALHPGRRRSDGPARPTARRARRPLCGDAVRIRIVLGGGEADLAALVPLRADRTAPIRGDAGDRPRRKVPTSLLEAEIRVAAVMEVSLLVGDAMGWDPGATLDLPGDPAAPLDVRCGDAALFRGLLGRGRGDALGLRLLSHDDSDDPKETP
ncbi:FliM/FliN family flagellar motor switch protein [Jannaschia sp. Os4]|uniref:FliM/FliN family flagellar motor switch protein n=1 Tax=Jannaschia sp. Os4 TaxID=2807617 RepID=UPI00193A17B9|nr:FliM/FliN family flagellar motor switch protein [Jannaschia sp. Os4]MBM2575666.1 FliM/FliN family flagellar motor switch protein [Jannaschia sp. Os4]